MEVEGDDDEFTVEDETEISLNGDEADIGAIEVGDTVDVSLEAGTVVQVIISQQAADENGNENGNDENGNGA